MAHKRIVFVFLFISTLKFFSQTNPALNTVFIATGAAVGSSGDNLSEQKGSILLKSGDTLTGFVTLENIYNWKKAIAFRKPNTKPRLRNDSLVRLDTIDEIIVVRKDTSVVKEKDIRFRLINERLYRLIYSSSKVEIYDRTRISNERKNFVADEILVIDKSATGRASFEIESKGELVCYLNEKYSLFFKKSDFKTRLQIIKKIIALDQASP